MLVPIKCQVTVVVPASDVFGPRTFASEAKSTHRLIFPEEPKISIRIPGPPLVLISPNTPPDPVKLPM